MHSAGANEVLNPDAGVFGSFLVLWAKAAAVAFASVVKARAG